MLLFKKVNGKPSLWVSLLCSILTFTNSFAQQRIPGLRIIKNDSLTYRTFCKNYFIVEMGLQKDDTDRPIVTPPVNVSRFLKISGNIRYDFMYRSFIDTPFSQTNFQQHTVQTTLNITVKDKYPLKLTLAARASNSPFFRNFLDANMQLDKYAFNRNYKQQLLDKMAAYHLQNPDLKMAEEALKQQIDKYASLKDRLSNPDIFQRIVEEREREYNRKLPVRGTEFPEQSDFSITAMQTLNEKITYKSSDTSGKINRIDSVKDSYAKFVESKKKELEQVEQNIARLQAKADSIKNGLNKNLASARQKIYKASRLQELKKIAYDSGIAEEKQNGTERFLSNIKNIGIGRSVINYSELTAMNISLTGLNIEYNPRIYAAFAAGKIDYGFRDFFGRNSLRKNQQLLMGRFGVGDTDKKALIFSVFTGRKHNYGTVLSDTASNYVNLAGYSIETIIKKDENTGLNIEVAKSTGPASGPLRKNNELKSLFRFADQSNMGISIKGQTILSQTDTRLSGFFRRSGKDFQSFSLFTYNTDQTAWLLKVDQSLLKNKIGLIAMLRRNDFTNPFSEKTFKTSTVFKSIQLNVRIPRWPSLSVGYYPGSQLYVIDKEKIRENAYYIINGSVVHSYSLAGIRMVSSIVYNQYDSKGTDTGFVSYNGVNYLLSHSILFKKLQLQGSFVYTKQPELQFSTIEFNTDYSPTKIIRIGAGGKYNKVAGGNTYWGGRGHLMIDIRKIGGFQLQYEKSFLPTIYQTLFPVEIGRVSWYKNF